MKTSSAKKIVIIGAGRVATALGMALVKKHTIVQVHSRKVANAKKLAGKLSCSYTDNIRKVNRDADIYIIAVKDDAIKGIANQLRVNKGTVLHTSGSIEMNVLKKSSNEYGVLYPLQTFSGSNTLRANTPFCIEYSDTKVKGQLTSIVKDLSGKPYFLSSVQRVKLHLAAVIVNNFSNHLFAIANEITDKANIPFDILLPLIEETVNKLKTQKPSESQTGPAVRNDKHTLKKHEEMLKTNARYLKLYKTLTQSIQASIKNGAKEL